MKKVISYSLWGNKPIYNIGALRNVELAKEHYPEFECWFYIHKSSVPEGTIAELRKHSNVKIIMKDCELETSKPMMWRFEAIDEPEVEVMMSRDTDSRIYIREKLAVEEWLKSDKLFHIMRDSPYHNYPIQGGMFGTRKNPKIPNWTNIMNSVCQYGPRVYDQDFLGQICYPIVKADAMIHASFHKLQDEDARPFPIEYDSEYHFVGEYVDENEKRTMKHVDYLKQWLGKGVSFDKSTIHLN